MTEQRARRRGRKTITWVGSPVALVLLLVVFAPTFINWGLGQGFIARIAERYVNGSVDLHRVDLGWFGPQSVNAEVADSQTVARIDLTLSAGLLGLLKGRDEALVIKLGGTMSGELYENGATSFSDLIAGPPPRGPDTSGPKSARGDVPRLPWTGPLIVRVTDLDIELRDRTSGRVVGVTGLNGELTSRPGERLTVQL